MFVILRGAHARFERGGRPASADDTCCPSASAEILRGSCALFGRPSHVPRDCPTPQVQASSPGGGTCAGSLVESGSVGASPGALRAHSSAHFFAALLVAKPEPFVRIEARILRCAAKSARCGARFCGRCRTHCPDVLPGRRLCLRGVRLRSTAGGRGGASFLPCGDSCAPAGVRLRAREAAFPAMFRRLGASPFCRGALTGFSCVSGRMAETHAAGKALTPARSRKRAECGRPGLPHSG